MDLLKTVFENSLWMVVLNGLLLYATAAFNWFPNKHSQELPHFLYFGCDPYLPQLAAFLQPNIQMTLDK